MTLTARVNNGRLLIILALIILFIGGVVRLQRSSRPAFEAQCAAKALKIAKKEFEFSRPFIESTSWEDDQLSVTVEENASKLPILKKADPDAELVIVFDKNGDRVDAFLTRM